VLLLLQADLLAEVSLPIVDAVGPVDAFCGWFDVEFKVRSVQQQWLRSLLCCLHAALLPIASMRVVWCICRGARLLLACREQQTCVVLG
jgi:hypothetical protein